MTESEEGNPQPWRLVPIAILIAASLLLSIPLIRIGLPYGMDAAEHLSWYRCFALQLWSGEAYPRWLLAMNGGLGSPDFFVYGPLPYYIAAVFRVLTGGPGHESGELAISIWLALAGSGVTAYLWLKDMAPGIRAPLIGALIYMALPYHIKTDLYTRVALAEIWAFVWMPLLLLFTRRAAGGGSRPAMAGFGLVYALLLLTHLFTAFLFSPVLLCYTWFVSESGKKARILATTIVSMALGAALAGFYLLPALAYQKYISPYQLIATRPDYLYYRNFLFAGSRSDQYLQALSWLTAWTFAVAAGFFLITLLSQKKHRLRESVYWCSVAVCSMAMMLAVSAPVWKLLPPLQAIQFPSRLNMLLSLAVAALATLAVDGWRRVRDWRTSTLLVSTTLLALGWGLPIARSIGYQQSWIAAKGAVNLDYLITAWAQWTDPKLISLRGIPPGDGARVSVEAGTAVIERWEARSIEFQVASSMATWVSVKQFYFPGWTAALSGGRSLAIRPSAPEGLVEIQVPAGQSDVRLTMPHGISEVAGALVSAASFLGLVWLYVGRGRSRRLA